MSIRIKDKLAKRRVLYGVGRLVGYERRGNLNFRRVVSTLFLLAGV